MSIEGEELEELMEMLEQRSRQAALVPDLAMLVRRLCRALEVTGRDSSATNPRMQDGHQFQTLQRQAESFLRKHKLHGSPLR